MAERGILSKNWTHVFHNQITDVIISKDVFGRLFDIGHVMVNTAGSDAYELVISNVKDPEAVQKYLLTSNKQKR